MRILYGIQGTGNGHLSRSSKIINKLKKLGCDVDIAVSGNNHQIDIPHEIKYNFKGFSFSYNSDGSINKFKTFLNSDFSTFLKDIKLNCKDYDRVISDFEPVTSWASKIQSCESFGISNQYSFLSKKLPRPNNVRYLDEFIIKNFAPCKKYFGLSYDNYDEFIYTPIIRDDVIKNTSSKKDHYVIYLPNKHVLSYLKMLTYFQKTPFYIFTSEVTKIHSHKNVKIIPVNKNLFLDQFLNCQGVITNSGFQTTSEAIYLNKKVLTIPIKGQYEQEVNSNLLTNFNVKVGDIEDISEFILSSKKTKKVLWNDPTTDIINQILS
jgi:uncharacterized protein (TIGR00661 family)